MAKRFTDTARWDKAWFRQLSPKLKCAWEYIVSRCDHAGIWDIDFDTLSFFVGEAVSLSEIQSAFQEKISLLASGSKIFIPGFIEFQYGQLNSKNRVHASVISKLEKLGAYKPLTSPLQGAKDKDKDKDKEEDKEKEGGVGETNVPALLKSEKKEIKYQLTEENLNRGFTSWENTLIHFKTARECREGEKQAIARWIQREGIMAVEMAFLGARQERSNADFNPADYLRIDRYLKAESFERFLNLGVQAWHKQKESA